MEPKWVEWAKKLQALSQNGLAFAQNQFDIDRYQAIREIAAEIVARGSGQPIEKVIDLFASQDGYATPKVDVRGAVFEDGRILMVRELSDGGWTLPGGWADPAESPSGNVEREVLEESGFETRAVKLLCVYDRSRHNHRPAHPFHVYKMFFLCRLIGGSPQPDHEISEVGFFEQNNLPPLSIARVTEQQIGRLFDHLRHPDWPTDFD